MSEENGEETAVEVQVLQQFAALQEHLHLNNQQEHGQTGNHVRHDHRRGNHTGEQGAAAEAFDARHRVACQRAQNDGCKRR